jgi:hypothetical protein
MLTHWVLIIFLQLNSDTVASTSQSLVPIDYGAVFRSEQECRDWAAQKLSSDDIRRYLCLPRPAYRNP